MSWILFEEKLRSSGYGKIGKLHKSLRTKPYGKKLAEEMGFEINTSSDSLIRNNLLETGDWITWTERSSDEIMVIEQFILGAINEFFDRNDLSIVITVNHDEKIIDVKTTKPHIVIGQKGRNLKQLMKIFKEKLTVEYKFGKIEQI